MGGGGRGCDHIQYKVIQNYTNLSKFKMADTIQNDRYLKNGTSAAKKYFNFSPEGHNDTYTNSANFLTD